MTLETDHIRCINEGGHVATQRHPRSECPEERGLEDRLRTAYATAMKACHEGGRVEVHIGIHVLEYLRSFMIQEAPLGQAPTVWGFPIKVRDSFPVDGIEVHTVQVIQ